MLQFTARPFIPLATAACLLMAGCGLENDGLTRVNHIIIVMQENHSFDNYFGVLPYAPGSPYHNGNGVCPGTDHKCVDGLTCSFSSGLLRCTNSNLDEDGSIVNAYKAATRCASDLDHSWVGTHREINFDNPNEASRKALNNGFVRQNDPVGTAESPTDDPTMSYYDQDDLPFYYELAEKFAISDRQFASVLGPTLPNRLYLMAATSFGLTSNETTLPHGGYKPSHGTIFDLLDDHHIAWADYFEDSAQDIVFRPEDTSHNLPLSAFFAQASGIGSLPQVAWVDPAFRSTAAALEDDEHPPSDIQRGQVHVSDIVNAVRRGPYWKDSIIFITYDEHGGFYDHVPPPPASQNGARTPDGIFPGQCADPSALPANQRDAACAATFGSTMSLAQAEALCPDLAGNPAGAFPANCAAFDQLGVRVPLIAVSPFSKPSYVSHTTGDHASLLALIERRFLSRRITLHLTGRDAYANDLEDLFDFKNSPSLNTQIGSSQPPQNDCTP
ncbi:MAG TPA: alkaline phosphatase family protein [Candidatus Sulfotelmatobacter sp.]|nr:alkaline phosphatase family protein [Candidatus Sulfotelmatobacter sp.]